MKVGDIVEFRCPAVFMEEKFKSRGVGIIVAVHVREYGCSNPAAANAFEVQWVNDEVSWEHKTYLELL